MNPLHASFASLIPWIAVVAGASEPVTQAPATPAPAPTWHETFWLRWQALVPATMREAVLRESAAANKSAQAIQSAWPNIDHDLYREATRPIPAGLSATRRAEREVERGAASAALAAELEGEGGAEWRRFLEERLRYFQDEPRQWIALAELVVELRRFDLAPTLAVGLEAAEPIRAVAQDSLASLYGKEFESTADFNAFVEGLELDAATLRLIDQLCAERDRAREFELSLFAFDPERAKAALDSTDRRLRRGAAQALAALLRDSGTLIDQLAPTLLERVGVEKAPEIAEVIIGSLADAIEGRPAGGPIVEGLRAELAGRAQIDPNGQRLVIARALAQLPWTGTDASSDAALERGAGLIAGLLMTGSVEQDPDVTLGVLQALNSLCNAVSVTPEAARRLEATDLRERLVSLAFEDQADLSARVVAVGILPRVAPVSGLQDLILLAGRESEPELPTSLRFAVLGAMGRFAAREGVDPADLQPLVTCLIEHTERPEADLRNLALELLGEGALAAHLEGRSVRAFVERLGVETDKAVLAKLIALIGKYGTEADLPDVLALEGFDALAGKDLPPDANLALLIQDLAGGDGELTLAGAMRLWNVEAELGLWARREAALGLIARLSTEAAAALSPEHHRTVAVWARDLRGAGVSLAAAMPGGADFLERLVDLHLAGSSFGPGFGAGEQNLWSAVFLSDLFAARGNAGDKELKAEILSKYARAEELSKSHSDPAFVYVVRSSRARFLVASEPKIMLAPGTGALIDGLGTALADFEFVDRSDHAGLLDTNDLRSAGLMAATLATPAGLERATEFSLALIARPSWTQEPLAVRVLDLEQLTERALAAGTKQREALIAFEELPAEMGVAETVAWRGLTLDRATWSKLRGSVANLEQAVAALPAAEGAETVATSELNGGAPATDTAGATDAGAPLTGVVEGQPAEDPPAAEAEPSTEASTESEAQAEPKATDEPEPPAGQPPTPPAEEPKELPTETPTEAPAEKPVEPPVEKPTDTPTEKPVEKPTEKPDDTPTEKPDDKDVPPQDKPSEAPPEDTPVVDEQPPKDDPSPGDQTNPADGEFSAQTG